MKQRAIEEVEKQEGAAVGVLSSTHRCDADWYCMVLRGDSAEPVGGRRRGREREGGREEEERKGGRSPDSGD